ncbi:MAG: DUF4350 domain-containing protein [Luteolibacter sp.]
MKRLFLLLAIALSLTGCDYTEVVREIGYKGKARINPWLAAERFCARSNHKVRSLVTWTAPQWEDAVWVMPASILSNASFTRQVEDWVDDGGHLVLLVEHADADTNDWSDHTPEPQLENALIDMLDDVGIDLKDHEAAKGDAHATKIEFDGQSFEVDAKSECSVAVDGEGTGVFASVESGEGRVTVITDGRIFRNRWISDKDHAALLDRLVRVTDFKGNIVFIRGSGLSLWAMLGKHLWPVLIGLGLLILLWLWKSFTRFGPIETSVEPAVLRGYDHHLEALGDFQWRLDRAVGLLAPLRTQIVERGQRLCTRSGRRDDDFFQVLADRAEISRERVFRALAEATPADAAILTRTTADLQLLLQVLS